MKWMRLVAALSLVVLFTAFSKKGALLLHLTHTCTVDTPVVLSCRPPSRAVALRAMPPGHHKGTTGEEEMVLIKGGSFQMGSADFPDAMPLHDVHVNAFLMDEHEVTNAQFAVFIKATHYKTVAERKLNPVDFPGVPLEKLVPGSAVFIPPATKVSLDNPMQWWQYVAGADWRHPQGAASSIAGKDNEPVVQVCYDDALAYAKWAGKRLPTEAEWEYAAQGGKTRDKYYWGDDLKPDNKWTTNIFQGSFPDHNTHEDGFTGVAPVKSFPANPYGLYDMDGNVWEWCSDLYSPDYYQQSPLNNPAGPKNSYDPDEPNVEKHVQRGGSFLCSDEYCTRYKAGSRGKGETSSASNNLGFRCIKDLGPHHRAAVAMVAPTPHQ